MNNFKRAMLNFQAIDAENKRNRDMRAHYGIADKPSCPVCGTEIRSRVCHGCGKVL